MYANQLNAEEERVAIKYQMVRRVLGGLLVLASFGLGYGLAFQEFLYTSVSIILISAVCFGFSLLAFKNGYHREKYLDMKGKAVLSGLLFLLIFMVTLYFIPGYVKDFPIYMSGEIHKVQGVPSEVDFGKDGFISSVTLNGKTHPVGNIRSKIPKQYRNHYFVIYYLPNSNFTVDQEIHGIVGNNRGIKH